MCDAKYKFTYFNLRGRGEGVRFIFHYAGVPFEDCRINKEDWPSVKDTMPTKQMPKLEITEADGTKKVLSQSMAIGRYLAKKFGLSGADDWEAAVCDDIVDTLMDVGTVAAMGYYEPDPERKAKTYEKLKQEVMPIKLGYLEKVLKENGGKFVVGKKRTWADLTCAVMFKLLEDYATPVSGDLGTDFPTIMALRKDVEATPEIAAYIAKRPDTDR